MYTLVLTAFIYGGYGTITQEFKTLSSCEQRLKHIEQLSGPEISIKAECVKNHD